MQSVMTRVLMADADACFNAGISSDIWKDLGAALGFSAAAIATTTAAAAAGSDGVLVSGKVLAMAPAGHSSSLFAAAVAVGTGIAAIAAATVLLHPSSGRGISPAPVLPNAFTSVVEMAGEVPSASFAAGLEESAAELSAIVLKAVIVIERETLHYQVGDAPDRARIVSDAGARGYDKNGDEVELSVLEYDRINFQKPDEYYVYLMAAGDEEIRRVVIISVE